MPCAISFPDPATTWNIFAQMLHENSILITDENLAEHSATPEESTLEKLGLVVHGTLADTSEILCFCRPLLRQFKIKDVERFKLTHLVQNCGDQVLNKVYQGTPVPNCMSMIEVRLAISAAASKKQISDHDRIGAGVWLHRKPDALNPDVTHEQLLLVGSHELAICNGGFEKSTDPTAGRKIIDFGGCEQWFDFDTLGQYLADAHDPQWRSATFNELQAVFQRWDNWEHGQNDALLAAALAVVTWLQTTWEFRPLVFVTGPTNCGKTMLLHEFFEAFYGNLNESSTESERCTC